MRVLTLTPFYPTATDDAQGCFVAEVLPWLEREGTSNLVIAAQPFYRGRNEAFRGAPARWVRYFAFPGNKGLPFAGAFLFARIVGWLRVEHRNYPIEVIHAHGPLPCGHAARLLGRELGIPYVVTVHGLDAYSTQQVKGRAGEWAKRVSLSVFRAAKRVICISEHVRQEVIRGGAGRNNSSVVYNGVDPEKFASSLDTEHETSVVSVGNLIPIKGQGTLLRSMELVLKEHPEARCEIVGDGPERGHLKDLAKRLGIEDHVRFHGRLPREKLIEILRCSTIFALPSRYEGLGCVYLEAMASGKAVIGCKGQGIEEVIEQGRNGWLVTPDQVDELAHAIGTLLQNRELREKISSQARQTILSGLTMKDQAERLMRIYRESVG